MSTKTIVSLSTVLFLFCSLFIYRNVPQYHAHHDIDSFEYDARAYNFAITGSLDDPAQPGQAAVQTVGYPLFLGVLYHICGHSHAIVIWLQIIMSLLTIYLLALLAYRLYSEQVARLVVLLCITNIGFYVYPQFLLAETVLLFLLVASLERLI